MMEAVACENFDGLKLTLVRDEGAFDPRMEFDYWTHEDVEAYEDGEVYGYVIEDENETTIDSCWGFYGYEYALESAREQAKYWAQNRADRHALAMVAGV
jgi:hypothetical protein